MANLVRTVKHNTPSGPRYQFYCTEEHEHDTRQSAAQCSRAAEVPAVRPEHAAMSRQPAVVVPDDHGMELSHSSPATQARVALEPGPRCPWCREPVSHAGDCCTLACAEALADYCEVAP